MSRLSLLPPFDLNESFVNLFEDSFTYVELTSLGGAPPDPVPRVFSPGRPPKE